MASDRAARFGTYPSLPMADSTASLTSGDTRGEPLITRDTVAWDTPAAAATVSRVGFCRRTETSPTVDAVLLDHSPVPVRAVLPGARAGLPVDMDDAEPLRVPVGPLEVVQQRPHEVSTKVDAGLDRPVHDGQVVAQVVDARPVVHAVIAHL